MLIRICSLLLYFSSSFCIFTCQICKHGGFAFETLNTGLKQSEQSKLLQLHKIRCAMKSTSCASNILRATDSQFLLQCYLSSSETTYFASQRYRMTNGHHLIKM